MWRGYCLSISRRQRLRNRVWLSVNAWIILITLIRIVVHFVLYSRRTIQTALAAKMVKSCTGEAKIDEVAMSNVSVVRHQISERRLTEQRLEGEATEEQHRSKVASHRHQSSPIRHCSQTDSNQACPLVLGNPPTTGDRYKDSKCRQPCPGERV